MAIKEIISQIKNSLTGQLDDEKISTISTRLSSLQLQADALLKSHDATKQESKSRKALIGELSQKLLQAQSMETEITGLKTQLERLNKYREVAVAQKKLFSDRIKTLFQTKLANETSKDYSKYKSMYPNFDFESDEQTAYDNNKKTYQLLQTAGVFGSDMLITTKPLPKSNPNDKQKTTSRWNK